MNLELIIKSNIDYIKNIPKQNIKGFMICFNFTLMEGVKNNLISKEKAKEYLSIAKEKISLKDKKNKSNKLFIPENVLEHNKKVILNSVFNEISSFDNLSDKEMYKKATNIINFSCNLFSNNLITIKDCEEIFDKLSVFYTKDEIKAMCSYEITDW